ncbi:MAG: fatty acid desaturase [Longimicrobiales bacterium]
MLDFGLFANTPWWVVLIYVAILGHITNLCVTLYLHRSATHEGVEFHPAVTHFMRGWLWLTTGVKTREWVACHRKHHAFSDREGDPHSPVQEGFAEIVFAGVFFYQEACKDQDMLEKYGKGCPDDWPERKLYSAHGWLGLLLMMILDLTLFGPLWGMVAWVSMTVWLPIFGNVINGIGHALGYRNFDTKDASRNIVPLGVWIVGEELHNNHHADPRSANFRAKWYEFDIGWVYIKLLSWFKLANVIYARSISARDFAEKYYVKAAHAAASAKEEITSRAAYAKDELTARASQAKDDFTARAVQAREEIASRAAQAKEEISARAASAGDAVASAAEAAAEALTQSKPMPATD